MKRLAILCLIAGTALAAFLIMRSEAGDILHAFATLGLSGFAIVVLVHLGLMVVMGLAWACLGRENPWHFVWARLVRDGAAEVLPLSQIGGFVLGARALALAGAKGGFASASTVVDVTMELIAQLFYTLLGLALLAWLRPGSAIEGPAITSAAAMAVLASLFVLAQRRGVGAAERMLSRLGAALLGPRPPGGATLRESIAVIHRQPRRMIASLMLHLIAWVGVGCETWLILTFIDAPVGLAAALVIDSLLSGLRSVAFMVPQALGIQEGAYVLLGALFGVAPEAALAVSLIRRARDVTIGAPALVVWQIIESRRAYRGV